MPPLIRKNSLDVPYHPCRNKARTLYSSGAVLPLRNLLWFIQPSYMKLFSSSVIHFSVIFHGCSYIYYVASWRVLFSLERHSYPDHSPIDRPHLLLKIFVYILSTLQIWYRMMSCCYVLVCVIMPLE